MPIVQFDKESPKIPDEIFIAPDAWVIGKVDLQKEISIFFGAVLRGDINRITVGAKTNIQEHAVLHTSTGLTDCIVGASVTIGHRAIIHGATVNDNCIIGMGAIILDGAVIGQNCIIGANSLITMNTVVPDGKLILGSPAKVIRDLEKDEIDQISRSAEHYWELGKRYSLSLKI